MKAALADQPAVPFRIPPGIRLISVDGKSGQVVRAGSPGSILEAFKPGTEPVPGAAPSVVQTADPATGVFSAQPTPLANPAGQTGTGGLY